MCKLEVYNVRGQKAKTLSNNSLHGGKYTVVWDGKDDGNRNVATGVYFYRLTTPNNTLSSKMLLMK
ncbi:MAG: T9SS type A sorting domain-containing protein [Candidatus Cloacimonetes bacterium]|jgi:flagellar hook assembly protein FlgD|nr:T9SS type A sorting domain-containing protein [Candidatus Cloacimonadota bacterium]